jgi:hypothetical protein
MKKISLDTWAVAAAFTVALLVRMAGLTISW